MLHIYMTNTLTEAEALAISIDEISEPSSAHSQASRLNMSTHAMKQNLTNGKQKLMQLGHHSPIYPDAMYAIADVSFTVSDKHINQRTLATSVTIDGSSNLHIVQRDEKPTEDNPHQYRSHNESGWSYPSEKAFIQNVYFNHTDGSILELCHRFRLLSQMKLDTRTHIPDVFDCWTGTFDYITQWQEARELVTKKLITGEEAEELGIPVSEIELIQQDIQVPKYPEQTRRYTQENSLQVTT